MEIGVRVEAEDMRTGEVRHTSSAYLTFVGLDDDGRPSVIPQMVPETEGISGVRLNLFYSRNTYVSGLDWSLFVSHTTTGMSKGAQFALVGINDADFVGFQGSFVNVNKGNFEGFQWGFVNYANHASGFQLGFVNYARTLNGLQIVLVNIIKQGGQFPVFPFINWSF